ncbi:MAG: CoA transferase [Desulfovibrio sp.]|nr:CoA transferase [Desulfovibrio sp.]
MQLLQGIRVLDMTTVIAAPFAAVLMADFGADVIKIEAPGKGDPFRALGPYCGKEPMRWAAMSRNKRAVTLDLRKDAGKEVFLKLVEKSDALLENFRVGTLDKWGLDLETLHKANPGLVVARVTGYGQTGPYAEKAGFGTPATAFSGMTYLTGYKDRPPVSPSFSLVDYVSGLYAALGVMMALYYRDALKGKAQEVDVSLYESIFRMLEIPVAEYHKNNKIRERTPGLSGTSSPGGTYETRDGRWVVLVCSTDRTWEYLTTAMKQPELKTDPRFATMRDRLANDSALDDMVRAWIKSLDYADMKATADREGVPVSLIYSIRDIFEDPHYAAREDIVKMPHPTLGDIKMPGIFPKFSETPGAVRWVGPGLGEHNREVYCGLLGYSREKVAQMEEDGVI